MFAPAEKYVRQCGPVAEEFARRALLLWSLTVAGAALLVAVMMAAPLLLASGHESMAAMIYSAFGYVCHQISERSFHLEGHALAVCARCTGIYAGFLLGTLLYPLVRPLKNLETPARLWLFVAIMPLAIDWTLGVLNIWSNTHLSRFITGAFFSAVCAFFVVPGLLDLSRQSWRGIFRRSDKEKSLRAAQPLSPEHDELSDYGSPSSRI
ncbi:MAG TPA: DUF2085 domain-containing protein [Pyrinomonadaceae bacterium]|jgi:uncharacterized membrane protein